MSQKADIGPAAIPDGVHFGLDKDRYHNDLALGSTDIRALLVHPAIYWWQSPLNPLFVPKETKYLDWGTAFDILITEGPEKFAQRYYRGPAKRDFKDELLVTADDLKKWLSHRGKAVSGKKEDLIKRVLEIDVTAKVWDDIEEKAKILAGDRIVLPPTDYDSISLSSHMITKAGPRLSGAFTNGYPAVSVFWTDRYGVRLKCRFDYLRYKTIVELKSFRARRQMPLMRAIYNAIGEYRLDIQAAHYLNGRERMADLIKAGLVFGDVPRAWLDRLLETLDEQAAEPPGKQNPRFVWIFYNAEGAPIAKRIDYHHLALYHDAAQTDITRGLESYRRNREVFGNEIWVDVSDPHCLTTEDLPAYLGIG